MIRNGGQSVLEFKYNADGIRTNKIVNGIDHVYTLNGTQIVSEAWGNFLLIYLYDESGAPIGLQYRTKSYAANVFDTFYFEKNLQGDIIAVYNASGEKIGSYTYDAWGVCTASVVSGNTVLENNIVRTLNPFRYRGYYYDTETQLYYLQSRYYNPAWGRFLNADGYISTGTGLLGYNMYVYCNNNPIMYCDPAGESIVGTVLVLTTFLLPYFLIIGSALYDVTSDIDDFSYSDELISSNDSTYIKRDNFEERTLWVDAEGGGAELTIDGESVDLSGGMISAAAGLDQGTYSWKYFEMTFGLVKGQAKLSSSIVDGIGGAASIESAYASACFKIPVFGHDLKLGVSGNIGGIGAKCMVGAKTEIGASFIGGGSIIVEWD